MECGFCESGRLHEQVVTREFKRDGYVLKVPGYRISVCDSCGSEFTSAAQARLNQRAKNEAEAQHSGTMTASQIRVLREEMGLSQAEASAVFGGGPNSFYKYESGEIQPTQSMERLLRMACEVMPAREWLIRCAGKKTTRRGTWVADETVAIEQSRPTPAVWSEVSKLWFEQETKWLTEQAA